MASNVGLRRRESHHPALFLDFDGVLHPDAAYREGGRVVLRADGIQLFEWVGVLEDLLAPYPTLQVVLSTSWVRVLGFDVAYSHLSERIRRRVVGATWYRTAPRRWNRLSRYEQIRHTVERHRYARWLAVDDDGAGWADEHRGNLVLTDPLLGLGVDRAQQDLREKLEWLHR